MLPTLPDDVRAWLRQVFQDCNSHIANRLQNIPTLHEPALDMALIERLSRYAAPVRFGSDWLVTITAEYEGGRSHWGRWEIADIAIIFMFRRPGGTPLRKFVLLQSKRLYPVELEVARVEGALPEFGRAIREQRSPLDALSEPRVFRLSPESRYRALVTGDQQCKAIEGHEADTTVPVYYHLYNPASIPIEATVPRSPDESAESEDEVRVGIRVVPYDTLVGAFADEGDGFSPSYENLVSRLPSPFDGEPNIAGWALESFVLDEALRCNEGYIEEGPNDYNVARFVSFRGAPISAAIAIVFDLPE